MPLPSFKRPAPVDVDATESFTADFVDVGNDFESLAKLFDLPRGSPTRIYEGELQFADFAARYRVQKVGTGAPTAVDTGLKVGADGSRFFGPNSAMRLDSIWVKELIADAGSKVAFIGSVW